MLSVGKNIQLSEELQKLIDVYFCHQWANELRSTPTADTQIDTDDLPADADSRWVAFVKLERKKYDKDQNSRLTPDEWPANNGDFISADANQDGSISLGEHYRARKKR